MPDETMGGAASAERSAANAAGPEPHHALESTARALCQFVIGVAALPVSMFFIKPSVMVESVKTGSHRLTPPPFLLALVTGVVVSGVIGNLDKLSLSSIEFEKAATGAGAPPSFSKAVFDSYMQSTDGVKALLLAIPYIAAIWMFAGLISLCSGRGFRNAEPLFAFLSLSLSAIVGIGMFGILGIVLADGNEAAVGALLVVCLVYALIIAIKLIRTVFLLQTPNSWSWVGATLASIPTFLIALVFGLSVMLVASGVGIGLSSGKLSAPSSLSATPDATSPTPSSAPNLPAATDSHGGPSGAEGGRSPN